MKLGEIRHMGMQELNSKVIELKAELAKEKAVVAGGTRPENPGKIRSIRKTIARVLTVIREKEKEQKTKQDNKTVKKTK